MSQTKNSASLLAGAAVVLFVGIALYLRVWLPYDQVIGSNWIKFSSVDAYYHMRLVDNLVHNFPHSMNFDPYMLYPGGVNIGSINFFDWLLASIIWLIGLGSPTQHTVDMVAVYYPAILGALTVIPVYFIGKELLGRWAGVISAGLIAILSGEFLGRSILGFTDHHVAETLFTAVTMLFLILAIKAARKRGLTFNHFSHRDWSTITRPMIYSLLAGIFLGIYLLTWQGALLFVFIISIYFIVQFVIDHLRRQSTDYLCIVGVILFLIAQLVFLAASPGKIYLTSLAIALLIPLVLNGISRLLVNMQTKPAYYPLSIVGLGLVGLVAFRIINPSLLGSMLAKFSIFAPSGAYLTVLEMQPLLFPSGNLTLAVAWANFTTGFFLCLISLGILIYFAIKQGDAETNLLIVWSLVILAATLGQRRFAYYFAVNVALLSGFLSWQILSLAGFKEFLGKPKAIRPEAYDLETAKGRDYYEVLGVARGASRKKIKKAFHSLASTYRSGRSDDDRERLKEIGEAYEVLSHPGKRAAYDHYQYGRVERTKGKRRRGYPSDSRISTSRAVMVLAVIGVFFLVFFPNIKRAVDTASQARFAPSDAWMSSLSWLKENTPAPFTNPDFYYEVYQAPPPGGSYDYPESAYGVIAWWDYGYWITRIGHRMPNANPTQAGAPQVARFFSTQDEDLASEMVRGMNSSYVIVDHATVISKFYAVAMWAGKSSEEFADVYYLLRQGSLTPVHFFNPDYYRSMAVRLYNFDGQAVTPESTTVICFEEKLTEEGKPVKKIINSKSFSSYDEATAYVLKQKSDKYKYKLVGTEPFSSPVPLPALQRYRLIHRSEAYVKQPGIERIPEVKIFEYTGD